MAESRDPLLQPYQLKHLSLRNRVMTTSHEPAYSEDGMPKDRYRLYHVERAKGGIALTMTAGSAVVSPDSPPVFGNLLAYKDEIVPWMRKLADECHEHGAAVMISSPISAGAPPGTRPTGCRCWRPRRSASRAPRLSQGGRGVGHRAHRRRLRGGRPADAGGRARRLRDRLRPPARPVLVAGDQPARR